MDKMCWMYEEREVEKQRKEIKYLKQRIKELEKQAVTDSLTGLINNRQTMESIFERESKRAIRYERFLSVLILDLDHFKQVNDSMGHPMGDKVLKTVAGLISTTIRGVDIACRYGGEEFLVFFPETHGYRAIKIAERIREVIQAYCFSCADKRFNCTISGGIAVYNGENTLAELIERADKALYQSKENGRNRISVAK